MPAKSEYRRKFVVDKSELKENYTLLLNFRKSRKSLQYQHTPLTWLSEEDDVANQEDRADWKRSRKRKSVNAPAPEASCSETRQLVEDGSKRQKSEVTFDVAVRRGASPSKAVQTDCIVPNAVTEQASTLETAVNPKSPSKRTLRSLPIASRAPLLAYGWADGESVTKKRTFNTLAPHEQVRESSLNALRQRDMRKKKRLLAKERIAKEKERNQALIDSLACVDVWQTEYQKSYCRK